MSGNERWVCSVVVEGEVVEGWWKVKEVWGKSFYCVH
jgi:hypothetical protein